MADSRLSADTVRSLAAQYSDWNPESVVRIAWRESKFVPTAFANDSDDLSYGLMQLNMKPGTADIARLRQMYGITRNEELFDPVVNIRAAHVLYNAAGNTFIRNWGVVPPVANYPTTGGQTALAQVTGSEEAQLLAYIQEVQRDSGENHILQNILTDDGELANSHVKSILQDLVNGKGIFATSPVPPEMKAIAQKILAGPDSTSELPWWNPGFLATAGAGALNPGTWVAGAADELVPDWTEALRRLLEILLSLSFWKKVAVGFIALFLLVGAFALYNKQTIQEVI